MAGANLYDFAGHRLRGEAVTTGSAPRRICPLPPIPHGVDGQRGCSHVGVGMSERVQGLNERCEGRSGEFVTTDSSAWVSTQVRSIVSRAGPQMSSGSTERTKAT